MGRLFIKKCAAAAVAVVMLVGVSNGAFAAMLSVGAGGTAGDYILGEVIPGVSSSDGPSGLVDRDAYMVNTLLGFSSGWHTVTLGTPPHDTDYQFYRSTTAFGTLPVADATTGVFQSGIGTMSTTVIGGNTYINIPLSLWGAHQYLVATYDGQNSGAQIWYIGGIGAGTIQIPAVVNNTGPGGHLAMDNAHNITTWTMYNPVPEPSTMIAGALLLLPFAASTVRFMRKNRKA